LRVLGRRLPPVGPVPLNLVVLATNQLSDRVVRFRVTGTVRHPVVQALPLSLLADEAVRFFLNRAILPAGASTFP
jgi:hypothetical protein